MNQNTTLLKGLSNYEICQVEVSAKDMILSLTLRFSDLQIEFPYKLDGYLHLKNFIPIYGEGIIK